MALSVLARVEIGRAVPHRGGSHSLDRLASYPRQRYRVLLSLGELPEGVEAGQAWASELRRLADGNEEGSGAKNWVLCVRGSHCPIRRAMPTP